MKITFQDTFLWTFHIAWVPTLHWRWDLLFFPDEWTGMMSYDLHLSMILEFLNSLALLNNDQRYKTYQRALEDFLSQRPEVRKASVSQSVKSQGNVEATYLSSTLTLTLMHRTCTCFTVIHDFRERIVELRTGLQWPLASRVNIHTSIPNTIRASSGESGIVSADWNNGKQS